MAASVPEAKPDTPALIASALDLGLLSALSDRDWRTLCALLLCVDDALRWRVDYLQLAALLGCAPEEARDRLGDLAERRVRGESLIFFPPEAPLEVQSRPAGFTVQVNGNLLDAPRNESPLSPIYRYAERLLGRSLSSAEYTDVQRWYHQFKFDRNVIAELLSECIEQRQKNWKYARKVAEDWFDDGVRVIEDVYRRRRAREGAAYQRILNALGIRRALTATEQEMLRKWTVEWGFSDEVVQRACQEAAGTDNPLRYVDRTLDDWREAGVRTVTDAERVAGERLAARREAAATRHSRARPRADRHPGQGPRPRSPGGPMQEQLLPKTRTAADDEEWLS